LVTSIEQTEGISSVEAISEDSPSGTVPLGQNKVPFGPLASATPTQVDGKVMLQATLVDQPDSLEAEAVVEDLRQSLSDVDSEVLVGGSTATNIDTRVASIHDRNTIIP